MENAKERLAQAVKEAEEIVYSYLPAEEGHQKTIFEAMNYSVKAGGKRLRPILMREVYRLFGGQGKEIEPLMAGASEAECGTVERMAAAIGLAFQIQDDILDVTSSQEVLGKPVLSDEKNNKTTYVTLEGIEKSKHDVKQLSETAVDILYSLPGKNEFLEELIEMLVSREK